MVKQDHSKDQGTATQGKNTENCMNADNVAEKIQLALSAHRTVVCGEGAYLSCSLLYHQQRIQYVALSRHAGGRC